jgi:hypothetical protein
MTPREPKIIMKTDEPETLKPEYPALLAACEAALDPSAASSSQDEDVPEEMRLDLERDLACVKLLRQAFADTDASGTDCKSVLPWSSLGRFEIRRELGRGSFGIVYLAHDPGLGREVALKIPRADSLADPDLRQRFQREARAAAGLDHPNLVPVYEAGEVGPVCYIASAYCPGTTLAHWLKQRDEPVPYRTAAELVRVLAEAVGYAHQRGVVHRDLKPGNILLSSLVISHSSLAKNQEHVPNDQGLMTNDQGLIPKITDFGLAKLLPKEAGLSAQTQSGAIVGTANYMAPEQAGGKLGHVGPAADIYALGVILYELLTGRTPFEGDTAIEVLLRVRTEEPLSPCRLRRKVPRDLETICLKCLHKEPRQRYASAEALAEDLRRFLAGEPIVARPSGLMERCAKWARRRPAVAALMLVSVVAVLAVGGVIAGLFYSARLQEAKDRAEVAQAVEARAREDADHQRQIAVDAVAEADKFRYFHHIARAHADWHDGTVARIGPLLEACPRDRRGWEWRYLKRLCHQDLLTLRGHTEPVRCLAFNPQWTRLASAGWDNTVRVWDARTGDCLLTKDHTDQVWGVAFSPDGTQIASGSWDGIVKVWDATTGQEAFTLQAHEKRADGVADHAAYGVAFSPDGKRLATAGGDWTVKVWDARVPRAALLTLHGHKHLVVRVTFSPDGKRLASASSDGTVKFWDAETGQTGPHFRRAHRRGHRRHLQPGWQPVGLLRLGQHR